VLNFLTKKREKCGGARKKLHRDSNIGFFKTSVHTREKLKFETDITKDKLRTFSHHRGRDFQRRALCTPHRFVCPQATQRHYWRVIHGSAPAQEFEEGSSPGKKKQQRCTGVLFSKSQGDLLIFFANEIGVQNRQLLCKKNLARRRASACTRRCTATGAKRVKLATVCCS